MQFMLMPAALLNIGFTSLAVYASEAGYIDRHIWDIRPERIQNDVLVSYAMQLVMARN